MKKTHLKIIDLRYNGLSNYDAGVIAKHIKEWSLAELDLSFNNGITRINTTIIMAACVNSSIQILHLDNDEYEDSPLHPDYLLSKWLHLWRL